MQVVLRVLLVYTICEITFFCNSEASLFAPNEANKIEISVKAKKYRPRLLHITGYIRQVQVYQLPSKAESLNNSDCFMLDAGLKVFRFNGTKSSSWEKRKANAITVLTNELQASRHGKVKETRIMDGIDDNNVLMQEFWDYFGGGRPNAIVEKEKLDKPKKMECILQHISNTSGVMEIKEVCKDTIDKSKLDSNYACILHAGTQLFIWICKAVNKTKKRQALNYATKYLKDQGRPNRLPIVSVAESKESGEFWCNG